MPFLRDFESLFYYMLDMTVRNLVQAPSIEENLYRKVQTYSSQYTHHYTRETIVFHELSGYILAYILLYSRIYIQPKRMCMIC